MNQPNTPPPVPSSNPSASTETKSFPQKAAKISLLLVAFIIAGNAVLRAAAPVIPELASPTASIVSTAVCALIMAAGLILGLVGLAGIGRYGRKNILFPALSAMIVHGLLLLILVTNFFAARSKAQQSNNTVAQFRRDAEELKENYRNDDSPNASSTHLEKLQKKAESAAANSTGAEKVMMNANSLFMKEMQERSRVFEDASAGLDYDEILNLATSGTKEGLAAKRATLQTYIDANASIRNFFTGEGVQIFRNELVKAKLPAKDVEKTLAALKSGFEPKLPMLLRVRDSVDGYAKAVLAVVNLLDENLGKWSYDEANSAFKGDETLEAQYQDLLAKIDVAGEEQAAAEEMRQQSLAR